MPQRRTALTASTAQGGLADALSALRRQLDLPEGYPVDAEAEASRAAEAIRAENAAGLPEGLADLREMEFLTIDPAGSTDLDQALHIARAADGAGFLVHYAIADVPAFVTPGGALDAETRRRGQTLYAPDGRIPLHPAIVSEDAASLLPGQDRRAFVWSFELDASGRPGSTTLTRALVRSRRQWSYEDAQAAFDDGSAPEPILLMKPLGRARLALEAQRGGASLNLPDEEVVLTAEGYGIERRAPLPIEDWNAQLSLMTGMAAARIMLDGGAGVLRTMPPAGEHALAEFRSRTVALGLPWTAGVAYGDYLRMLDRAHPAALAVLQAAAALFRGAGYASFDARAGLPAPAEPQQAALAAPYAHVTAPLRRLVDRWGLVICEALANGRPVPEWARASLAELPHAMASSSALAGRLDSGALDRVEAALLEPHLGEEFEALVLSQSSAHTRIRIAQPAVEASLDGVIGAPGATVRVRLLSATVATGAIAFQPS